MDEDIKELINIAVNNMIEHTSNDKTIDKLLNKHSRKIHFIPKRYRVFGGILHSMNIQFGNFIEELMSVIISKDGRYEIIKEYSGKKSNKFTISQENEMMIDNYISRCQEETDFFLEYEFTNLLDNMIKNKQGKMLNFEHDIDLLFREKSSGVYYYLEIKYNDDHDTGKFVDINRKFIKTTGYLINELDIKNLDELKPILFFFNNKKMKGNIYIPENTNIYRGRRFFDEFLNIEYTDVESYMANISESEDTIRAFDDLYTKVINYNK